MLGDYAIHPVLLSKDLSETRRFYHDQLGLEILSENEQAITFHCGPTQLDVTKSTTGTSDTQTQAGWNVPDLRAEVEDIRSRGIKVEDYDLPGGATSGPRLSRSSTPSPSGGRWCQRCSWPVDQTGARTSCYTTSRDLTSCRPMLGKL